MTDTDTTHWWQLLDPTSTSENWKTISFTSYGISMTWYRIVIIFARHRRKKGETNGWQLTESRKCENLTRKQLTKLDLAAKIFKRRKPLPPNCNPFLNVSHSYIKQILRFCNESYHLDIKKIVWWVQNNRYIFFKSI